MIQVQQIAFALIQPFEHQFFSIYIQRFCCDSVWSTVLLSSIQSFFSKANRYQMNWIMGNITMLRVWFAMQLLSRSLVWRMFPSLHLFDKSEMKNLIEKRHLFWLLCGSKWTVRKIPFEMTSYIAHQLTHETWLRALIQLR